MNLDQDLVFAYLEEDNIQRAYFRVRPLLTIHGNVHEEAVQLWPDEGCLRIVPDRAEQHTFKDRMRTLGHYCALDLRGIPADAGKIRTNKNYRPERGEINQYILYSDTVKPLPEHTFFEVVDGQPADAAALAEKAVTPMFYIRSDDTLYGPVSKAAPQEAAPAAEAAATLFPLDTPDGVSRLILCMPTPVQAAPPAAPAEPEPSAPVAEVAPPTPAVPVKEDAALPLGKHLDILDASKTHDETLHGLDQPLSKSANLLHTAETEAALPAPKFRDTALTGTPLVRTQLKTSVPQPKNKLQEVVANQWRVARYEPPADSLPAGTTMRQVDNPVENACQSLKSAWQVSEAQTQLMDFILSLDGMRAKLEPRMIPAGCKTPLQKAMIRHLEDLEAERLAALIELDKAKTDVESFRKVCLAALSEKTRAECTHLSAEKEAHENSIQQMKEQLSALTAQRDELLARVDDLQHSVLPAALAKAAANAQITTPVSGIPLRMNRTTGIQVGAEELISRVMAVTAASGAPFARNEAVALLALLAVCPRIGLTAATPAVAATIMRNVVASLGWLDSYAQQVSPEQQPMTTLAPVDTTPAILLTALPNYAPLPAVTKILLARASAHLIRNAAYDTDSWPILSLSIAHTVSEVAADGVAAVSANSLQSLFEKSFVSNEQIDAVLADLTAVLSPLSGRANNEMHRFITACAAWMDGGLSAACDWAILLWFLPNVERNQRNITLLQPLLQEYPLSLAKLLG